MVDFVANEMTHSALGPSGAARWVACPGSVRESAPYPDTSNEYADEGTALHQIMSEFAKRRTSFSALGRVVKVGQHEFEIDDERQEACMDAWAFVTRGNVVSMLNDYQILYDVRVDLGKIVEPGQSGTLDYAVADRTNRRLRVFDYKFGRGVQVWAQENKQMILYGLGALQMLGHNDFDVIEVNVVQPRLGHYDTWEFTRADFRKWVTFFREAAARTHEPDAPLNPGDHCKFCKAQPYCSALRERAMAVAMATFDAQGELLDPETKLPVKQWDDARLAQILKEVPMIESFAETVKGEAKRRAMEGHKIPGFKLVAGRNTRSWTAESHAIARMRADGLEPMKHEVLSVAQAEKNYRAVGKPFPTELVAVVSGAPSLVSEADKRPELARVEDIFGALE